MIDRRSFLGGAALGALGLGRLARAATGGRPVVASGVQSGDPTVGSAMIWARCDRPARMVVEWSTSERFASSTKVLGPTVTPAADLTGMVELRALPPGADIFYRVSFDAGRGAGAAAAGRLRTPARTPRDLLIAFSGDTCGQGWGINPDWGGLRGYESIRRLAPDVFIHSGDQVYADGPISPEVAMPDGRVWRNLVTPAKSKVAETLDEFRGQFAYNRLDEHVCRLSAEVPIVAQWDDHEVRNNWSPGQDLRDDARYTEKNILTLAGRAKQAFREWNPIRPGPIHRRLALGPTVEIFVLDARSFHAANGPNHEPHAGPSTALLGAAQLAWLADGLAASRATWKIVACDLPLGLIVPDGPTGFEAFAQGAGPPLGREHEIAALLSALRSRRVGNVLFVTADVHYAAAHRYQPERATFADFDPFWELVAGPLHAGTFGPNALDPTFGPEVVFQRAPKPRQQNLAPWDGMQSFGTLRIDGKSRALTAALHDGEGAVLWQTTIEAINRRGRGP